MSLQVFFHVIRLVTNEINWKIAAKWYVTSCVRNGRQSADSMTHVRFDILPINGRFTCFRSRRAIRLHAMVIWYRRQSTMCSIQFTAAKLNCTALCVRANEIGCANACAVCTDYVRYWEVVTYFWCKSVIKHIVAVCTRVCYVHNRNAYSMGKGIIIIIILICCQKAMHHFHCPPALLWMKFSIVSSNRPRFTRPYDTCQ